MLLFCASSEMSKTRGGNVTYRETVKLIRSRNLKILIIDDEDGYRASMKALLETIFKAKVDDVESGAAGIAKIQDGNNYDVIFLDLMMPAMNGNETRSALLKVSAGLFIAFMSAYSDSQEWQIAKNSGVPLLSKPLQRDDLMKVLTQAGDVAL